MLPSLFELFCSEVQDEFDVTAMLAYVKLLYVGNLSRATGNGSSGNEWQTPHPATA
jgi:hypothetical protein